MHWKVGLHAFENHKHERLGVGASFLGLGHILVDECDASSTVDFPLRFNVKTKS